MVTKELVDYIKEELKAKKKLDDIVATLLNTGWGKQDIDGAVQQVNFQLQLEKPSPTTSSSGGGSSTPPGTSSDPKIYPIISIPFPTSPNRLWAIPLFGGLVKIIIVLPVLIEVMFVSIASSLIIALVNSFIVLFTGKYLPLGYKLFMFSMRLNIKSIFFMWGITDRYPGFNSDLPSDFIVDWPMPEQPNRMFAIPLIGAFVRGLLLIPFKIYGAIMQQAAALGSVIASFPVLITGKYPESIYELVLDQTRLLYATNVYESGLSDTYPSFKISWNHKWIKIALIVFGILSFIVINIAEAYYEVVTSGQNSRPRVYYQGSPNTPTREVPIEDNNPSPYYPPGDSPTSIPSISATPRVLLK